MSSFRNRRSSLQDSCPTASLSRNHSNLSSLSSTSSPKILGGVRRSYDPHESPTPARRSSLRDTKPSRVGAAPASNVDYLFSTKEKSFASQETYRPLRRKSESNGGSSYRIGAFRHEPAYKQGYQHEVDTRFSSSKHSYMSPGRTASLTVATPPRSSIKTSSGLTKATSRTSSVGSSREAPSAHRAAQEETAPRLSALNRSLSGKLSGSQLSSDSRTTLRNSATSSTSSSDERYDNPPQRRNGLCGIRNVGNSCYQNSVLQFLNAIPEVVRSLRDSKGLAPSQKIAFDLKRFFNEMSRARDYSVVDTFGLRRKLGVLDNKWAGYSQEDAHEFLTQIISALQEDCNRNAVKPKYRELEEREDARVQAVEEWKYSKQWNDSGIDDVFGFQLHSQTTCPQCNHQSNRFGYQTSLELPLPNDPIDLSECLLNFASTEILNRENAWQCPKCKEPVQAVQQLRLSRLPKVLIICLKRFGTSKGRFLTFQSWKNNVAVRLPNNKINLTDILSPIVDSMTEQGVHYELSAIVDHSGSVNFGHYTARVKDEASEDWYLMNDDIVRRIGRPTGPSESAYILALRQVETS